MPVTGEEEGIEEASDEEPRGNDEKWVRRRRNGKEKVRYTLIRR